MRRRQEEGTNEVLIIQYLKHLKIIDFVKEHVSEM